MATRREHEKKRISRSSRRSVASAAAAGAAAGLGYLAGLEAYSPPAPQPANPATADLLRLVRDAPADDAYQHLMAKERRVLDTVDRVVAGSPSPRPDRVVADAGRDEDPRGLLELPLHVLGIRVIGAVREAVEELLAAARERDPQRAVAAVLHEGRAPYLGLAVIALTVLLAMAGGV